jgi:hypothetical protein
MHPDAQHPAHGGHVHGVEREAAMYRGHSASRLTAAVHVHISAPDARGKIER